MTACYVCGAEISDDTKTVAARIITPGPGLVLACSPKCFTDPKFAHPTAIRNTADLPSRFREERLFERFKGWISSWFY